MVVELISVGTELLLGHKVNTNAAFLAEQFAQLGLSMYYQTVVGDNAERLYELVETAYKRSDVVILVGGLGPTKDDLTKETVARFLNRELVEDEHSRKVIEDSFKNMSVAEIPENNWKQALVPVGSVVVENKNGTAPGLIIEDGDKTVILLPGPKRELMPMFENDIAPYLRQKQPDVIYSAIVKLCGISESKAEEKIHDLIDAQTNPTIAAYANNGEVHFRVTAHAEDEKSAKKLVKPIIKIMRSRFGNLIYTMEESVTLEQAILAMLRDRELTLTTAESLTGGMVAARLTDIPGASTVFKEGFVTYNNRAKHKMLDVKKSTLKEYGAVSEKTAKEMAKNGAFISGSDICISLTGLAGPNPEEGKPVGLVYMACSYNNRITVKEYHFKGSRARIRELAVTYALTMLRVCILEDEEER